jgi:hypothetical protein
VQAAQWHSTFIGTKFRSSCFHCLLLLYVSKTVGYDKQSRSLEGGRERDIYAFTWQSNLCIKMLLWLLQFRYHTHGNELWELMTMDWCTVGIWVQMIFLFLKRRDIIFLRLVYESLWPPSTCSLVEIQAVEGQVPFRLTPQCVCIGDVIKAV